MLKKLEINIHKNLCLNAQSNSSHHRDLIFHSIKCVLVYRADIYDFRRQSSVRCHRGKENCIGIIFYELRFCANEKTQIDNLTEAFFKVFLTI